MGDDCVVQINVRRATAADAPILARLRWRWHIEEHTHSGVEREAYLNFFIAWFLDHQPTHLPFLVEVDGRVSGMAWLMLAERVPSPERMDRRTGDVQTAYVVPEARDKGAGAALMAAILTEARNRELEHVTVHGADRALPFYLRAGFRDGQNWLHWSR
jgi:GNAT superfamily N-acetyltransferase